MTTTPFIQIDFMNRKQLARIASENQVIVHANLTVAQLITAIKAR
jgi:hypothetical protein